MRMGTGYFIILLLIVAAVIILISIVAYNRRLDRITSGELHDTHSSIPEPGTTVGATYRIVLMVVVVLSFLGISTVKGTIDSMQNTINNLRNEQSMLSREIGSLRAQIEESGKRTASVSWDILDKDLTAFTAEITYTAALKQYTENTAAALDLNGKSIPLERSASGTYTARFTIDLSETFEDPQICITEDGKTIRESVEFPDNLLWKLLPFPEVSSSMSSGVRKGKLEYEGSYTVFTGHPEDVASASVTYLTGGKEIRTMDITQEVLDEKTITLDKGMELENDLVLRFEIVTRTGLRIVRSQIMMYKVSENPYEDEKWDFLRVLDKDGNTVWDAGK